MKRYLATTVVLTGFALAGCAATTSSVAARDDDAIASAPGAPVPAGYAAVPIELVGHLAYVRGSVGGEPLVLILDTGASFTTFARRDAQRLGLRSRATGLRSTGIGPYAVQTRQLPTITIDYPTTDGSSIAVIATPTQLELESLQKGNLSRGGEAPAGLLGLDVLKSYDAVIDIPNRRMLLKRR